MLSSLLDKLVPKPTHQPSKRGVYDAIVRSGDSRGLKEAFAAVENGKGPDGLEAHLRKTLFTGDRSTLEMPLHQACELGHTLFVEDLLEYLSRRFIGVTGRSRQKLYQAFPNLTDSDMKRTALHVACARMLPGCVSALIKHGANPLLRDKEGSTALHLAVKSGCAATVAALLLPQRLITYKDKKGHTHATCNVAEAEILQDISGRWDFCKYVDCRDGNYMTPLQLAVWDNKHEIVEVLLKNGATMNLRMQRELEGVRISAGLLHIAARRDALASTLVILHIAAHKRKELREQGVTTVTNPREHADPRLILDSALVLPVDQVKKRNLILAGLLSPKVPLDRFLERTEDVAALQRTIEVKTEIHKVASKLVAAAEEQRRIEARVNARRLVMGDPQIHSADPSGRGGRSEALSPSPARPRFNLKLNLSLSPRRMRTSTSNGNIAGSESARPDVVTASPTSPVASPEVEATPRGRGGRFLSDFKGKMRRVVSAMDQAASRALSPFSPRGRRPIQPAQTPTALTSMEEDASVPVSPRPPTAQAAQAQPSPSVDHTAVSTAEISLQIASNNDRGRGLHRSQTADSRRPPSQALEITHRDVSPSPMSPHRGTGAVFKFSPTPSLTVGSYTEYDMPPCTPTPEAPSTPAGPRDENVDFSFSPSSHGALASNPSTPARHGLRRPPLPPNASSTNLSAKLAASTSNSGGNTQRRPLQSPRSPLSPGESLPLPSLPMPSLSSPYHVHTARCSHTFATQTKAQTQTHSQLVSAVAVNAAPSNNNNNVYNGPDSTPRTHNQPKARRALTLSPPCLPRGSSMRPDIDASAFTTMTSIEFSAANTPRQGPAAQDGDETAATTPRPMEAPRVSSGATQAGPVGPLRSLLSSLRSKLPWRKDDAHLEEINLVFCPEPEPEPRVPTLLETILTTTEWAEPSSESDSEGDDNECLVCFTNVATLQLRPCNHKLCENCVLEISKISLQPKTALVPLSCPFCRRTLESVQFYETPVKPKKAAPTTALDTGAGSSSQCHVEIDDLGLVHKHCVVRSVYA